MLNCRFHPAPDDLLALDIAYTIYMKFEDLANALRIALLLDNKSIQYVKQVYTATDDLTLKKQFSYIIARHVCIALFSLSPPCVNFDSVLISLVILSISFCN